MTVLTLGLEAEFASSVSVLSSISGWALVAALAVVIDLGFAAYVVSSIQLVHPAAMQPTITLAPERRKVLKKVGLGVLAIAVVYFASRLGLSLFSGQPLIQSNTPIPVNTEQSSVTLTGVCGRLFSDPRIADLVASEVTDTRIFYRVDIDSFPTTDRLRSVDAECHRKSRTVNSR